MIPLKGVSRGVREYGRGIGKLVRGKYLKNTATMLGITIGRVDVLN